MEQKILENVDNQAAIDYFKTAYLRLPRVIISRFSHKDQKERNIGLVHLVLFANCNYSETMIAAEGTCLLWPETQCVVRDKINKRLVKAISEELKATGRTLFDKPADKVIDKLQKEYTHHDPAGSSTPSDAPAHNNAPAHGLLLPGSQALRGAGWASSFHSRRDCV